MAVQMEFTNKCSFYITLSVNLLFDHLPLIVITFYTDGYEDTFYK